MISHTHSSIWHANVMHNGHLCRQSQTNSHLNERSRVRDCNEMSPFKISAHLTKLINVSFSAATLRPTSFYFI